MMRALLLGLALVAAPAAAQTSYPPSAPACRQIYSSNGTATVGNNSTARTTMLPPAQTGTTLTIPANALLPGGSLRLQGSGIISASTVGSPQFSLYPSVTPAGGSKVDLPGFSAAPLIGVVGMTWIDLQILQTPTGLRTGGVVSYAAINTANNYPNPINNAGTVVASDFTVARTIDVEGAWSVASASNYVTPQIVTMYLCPPGA